MNPFKFGTVVDTPYFTDRIDEQAEVKRILDSNNHLIMISPRRFGKTSLIKKVIKTTKRKTIFLDVQLANSPVDFAGQYLKRIYRIFPAQRIKQGIKNFRVLPSLSLHPISGDMEVSFQSAKNTLPILEDVLNLAEKLSSEKNRLIVVFDEFQDILKLEKQMDKKLRAILQNHSRINYVFLGSQESMMKDVFEKKKSPFYHFGTLFPLQKISNKHFVSFLQKGLQAKCKHPETLAKAILDFTDGHPYYTQQLAFVVYNRLLQHTPEDRVVTEAIEETGFVHDYDYERLWANFNTTDKKMMTGLATFKASPLSSEFLHQQNVKATSTLFSSLNRLMKSGYIIKTQTKYEIDDPFFKRWIVERRKR
jgi:hypothetical protein